MHGWQANRKTHLCVASSTRAMPENETPPVIRGDIYSNVSMRKESIIKKSAHNRVRIFWWAITDSNRGPSGYEPGALTN